MSNAIPRMVKHVAMALWRKKVAPNFAETVLLARHHLAKHGYLTPGSTTGPDSNIKMTAKGRKRDREKQRKSMRTPREFDLLYAKHVQPDVPGKVDKDSPKEPDGRR